MSVCMLNVSRIVFAATVLLLSTSSLADEGLQFGGTFHWYNAVTHNDLATSPKNPGNQALNIPEWTAISEFRPDMRLTHPQAQIVLRPRLQLSASREHQNHKSGGSRAAKHTSDSTINEAFIQWRLSDAVSFTYGRQSFQWGPTEFMSPSNRMFHESALRKDVLYDVMGKNIGRLNVTAGKSMSFVLMTEYEENPDEQMFRSGYEFEATTLGKAEFNWNDGADYIGLVVGGREHARGWIGEYINVNVPFIDGLSLYSDLSHQRGSASWYPVESRMTTGEYLVALQQSEIDSDKTYTIAVAGVRYDFEGGTILRAEYISNEAGYDEDQQELLALALRPQTPPTNEFYHTQLERALAPGLEVPGQQYVFLSLYWPDAFTLSDLLVYARGLYSLTDASANFYGSLEYPVGDAGTVFLSGVYQTSGSSDSSKLAELQGLVKGVQTIGYKHAW